ncbi:MAG: glycerol-3-phosphate 1-O-acyltransferase PlsY [Candidatus Cloacimonadota bacterium]|nr:glycerol-3-phosphate 1-O-acyltransferase PlsY [Candidatus Cloacimonadota bacterium]
MKSMIISSILLASYLIGSIPTSFIFGKLVKGIDIRDFGSGNVGATNALRVLGTKIGIITLIIDIAKGFITVFLGKIVLEKFGISNNIELLTISIAFAAIIGHIFTIYLKFKGGKGVATSAGVFIALTPIPILFALIIFLVTVVITRYVSLGSILGAISLFIVELIINIQMGFSQKYYLAFVSLVALFIVIKHKANIGRLLAGNENKISFKKG